MRIALRALAIALLLAVAAGCAAGAESAREEESEMKMNVQIGAHSFTAVLEDNPAALELVEMMRQGPVTLALDDYGGFEKVGPLGAELTASDEQTVTAPGDIVLYAGRNIVMFYGSNAWAYTRLGHIDDLTGWEAALGSGSVTAVLTLCGE